MNDNNLRLLAREDALRTSSAAANTLGAEARAKLAEIAKVRASIVTLFCCKSYFFFI